MPALQCSLPGWCLENPGSKQMSQWGCLHSRAVGQQTLFREEDTAPAPLSASLSIGTFLSVLSLRSFRALTESAVAFCVAPKLGQALPREGTQGSWWSSCQHGAGLDENSQACSPVVMLQS